MFVRSASFLFFWFSISFSLRAQTPVQIKTSAHVLLLTGDTKDLQASFESKQLAAGLDLVTLHLRAPGKWKPRPLTIALKHPLNDIQAKWSPATLFDKAGIRSYAFTSRISTQAPVLAFYNTNDQNRLTLACSDALNSVVFAEKVVEDSGELLCELKLFTEPQPDFTDYQLSIRLDTRPIPCSEALRQVSQWWETFPFYKPAPVPAPAARPMYSTWYSYHQQFTPAQILRECRLARPMGCETVIVDDGWQTLDTNRGYAYTGDWEPRRVPQMKAFVDSVHGLNMKFMLWYAVPFMGRKAQNYERFRGKYLYDIDRLDCSVLDPRFPEVRRYLIDQYKAAATAWGLDGFKLDFIDRFIPEAGTVMEATNGRDYASVNLAVDRLMTDILTELRAQNPDVLIEFRQAYTGPLMRKYGNMFRAADCPNDALENKVRVLDLRLLAGTTAVHSDMLMWHANESAERAAWQLLYVLFSVPQISVRLAEQPARHRAMLTFWLKFWNDNQELLLRSPLRAQNPQDNYPLVLAGDARRMIVAAYSPDKVAVIDTLPQELLIINASPAGAVTVEMKQDARSKNLLVYDCTGQLVATRKIKLKKGLNKVEIPISGLAKITN
ncbi:alpha-galactosidase [Hymenobacter sp.]|uniref:glycoside hydrolase family 36 protein n=1 Tax=Hymenobacter sp. TaxID=1898978 RepID=UPI00286B69E0|nr:alpha-galactosidase [Hymenobacter sp.]